jgi:hypothetical protein
LLWFENGKFRGRRGTWQVTAMVAGTRSVAYQFLWGRGPDGKFRLAGMTSTPDSKGGLFYYEKEDDFAKLDGGGTTNRSDFSETIRGYRVLGYFASSKRRPGAPGEFGTLEKMLEYRETVAVFGLKTFATSKEAGDWFFVSEPADP